MTAGLFALVLTSALAHAGWNFAARRAAGDLVVLWWGAVIAAVGLTPAALVLADGLPSSAALACMLATGTIHAAYYVFLGRAYEKGHISTVYPVARGSGIALTAAAGWWLLSDTLSPTGILGIAGVTAGVVLLALPARGGPRVEGLAPALAVGATIPAYSLIDKIGAGLVHPVVYIWAMFSLSSLLLVPWMRRRRPGLRATLRRRWRQVLIIGPGSMLTYLVILFAYQLGPIGYIVAARETSVVFGALLGVLRLGEPMTRRKAAGIAGVFAGLLCLRLA